MKKLLVVLLAVVLVFGFATTAMAADTLSTAYPDLSDKDTTVQDAFMKLSALDIFGGYPDGTIRPDANITRAEFAKIACILSGMSSSADVLKDSASKFSDVAAGQWYTGYVNLATSLGFVSGYPDGTFKPNNNITMQEALTVLLRIAGYNDNLVGPWPLNYIAQGGKLDVTDDVAFAGAAPATRSAIAVMAANILDVNVVYWDGDKSKFVEDTQMVEVINVTYVEEDPVKKEVPITVLEDKFGAAVENDVMVYYWEFDDFNDQELLLNYTNYFFDFASLTPGSDSNEMAEEYWISDGQVINTLGKMLVNLIMNDDGEIVYVDVISSYEYSDDVTIDDGNVEVNGSSKKIADYAMIDDDGDYTAKVFYNDDNEVYLVDSVEWQAASPYVFETYNATKDRIETYYNGDTIDTDVDLAILKNGYFITPADLEDQDILNYVGTASGTADAVYVVTSFSEGELTKATSTKLTIGGTALVFAYGEYSDDAMDSFNDIAGPDSVDGAYGTTVQYAPTLVNPYDLRVMVFTGEATNTLYGIITDVSANIDGQVSAITVLGKDGEEVEYTVTKGDNTSRPAYHNYDELYDYPEDGFDLSFGTYIEAKVSEDGTIDTDDIQVLVDPVFYGDEYWNWYNDLNGYGVFGTDYVWCYDSEDERGPYDINNNRIKIDGVYYTLTDDTLVFQTTTTRDLIEFDSLGFASVGEFDKAEVIDVADLMAADEISYGYVSAFIDNGVVKQLYLLDTDLTSTSAFGVIDSFSYYSGDWHIALLDGSDYTISDTNYDDYDGYEDRVFVSYTLSGNDLTADTPPVLYTEWCDEYDDIHIYVDSYEDIDGNYYYGDRQFIESDYVDYDEDLDRDLFDVEVNGSIMTINGINYTVTDDTVFYYIDGIDITEGDIYDIEDNGTTAVVCLTTDDPTDDILDYVFIVKYELCYVYYGYGWPIDLDR